MFRTFLQKPLQTFTVFKRCAGHSKWANIKHTKALKDGQKSALFTRLGRQMKVAISEGGSTDPAKNLALEQVIEQAKRHSMPAATIQSIIKSAQMDKSQAKYYLLELKGPGGSLVMVEIFTDNIHRTKAAIATIVKKCGCKFADGGAKHMFHQKGKIDVDLPEKLDNKDALVEQATDDAIECGAEDVQLLDHCLQFICDATNLRIVTTQLEKKGYKVSNSTVDFIAIQTQELGDADMNELSAMYDKLEKLPELVRLSDNIA